MGMHYFPQSVFRQLACHAMGFSLMTPASVFAVRHKELSMLIPCSDQPQNKSA